MCVSISTILAQRWLSWWGNTINLFLVKPMKVKMFNVLKCVRYCICEIWVLDRIMILTRNGSFLTNINDRFNTLIMTKRPNTFQNRKCTNRKIMLTGWWSAIGVLNYSILESLRNIAAEVYCRQLDECILWSTFFKWKCPILLDDNAWPHIAKVSHQKLRDLRYRTCHIHHIPLISRLLS